MALLDIAEPGQTAAPHQKKISIGIDLGTTNSLVATVRNSSVDVLNNLVDSPMTPSVVYYTADDVAVGVPAIQLSAVNPHNGIRSVKRIMGKDINDVKTHSMYQENIFAQKENSLVPYINTLQGLKSAEEVSAAILTYLYDSAKKRLGVDAIDGAVITVPAYFDDSQRQSTKRAAMLAGINILRLINEPTAAAIAYGLDTKEEGIIAVYDLGGGTFDISILRLEKEVFTVLATGGDTALGGDDFDIAIRDFFLQQTGFVPQDNKDWYNLLSLAKQAKTELSTAIETTMEYKQYTISLTVQQFNELISKLVKKSLRSCKKAINDAGISVEDIKNVVLVGGSTRVPFVRTSVNQFFQKEALTDIDPDKVVAIGAAKQANILVGNSTAENLLLLDVNPLSLGIETMGGLVEKIIPRNSTIPTARSQDFTTFKDGQTAMSIHVLQGEREFVKDCRSLAKFSLRGIPPMSAGAAQVRITFQIDADGLLSVTAMEKETKVQTSVQVKPSYGITEDDVLNIIKSSSQHASEDFKLRELVELKISASSLIEATVSALQSDGNLISVVDQQALLDAIDELTAATQTDDENLIKDTMQVLDKLSANFAAVRMDDSIRKALTGANIDKF